jgi:hypothetical protein
MVQTSLGFNGRFWPIRRPLFHGSRRREEAPRSAVRVDSVDANLAAPKRRTAIDRLGKPTPKGRNRADSGHSQDCDGAAAIQPIAGTGPEYPSVGSAAPGAGTPRIFFSVTTFMTLFLF